MNFTLRDRGTHTFVVRERLRVLSRVHVCEICERMSLSRLSDGRRDAVSLIEIIEILISKVFICVDATPVILIPCLLATVSARKLPVLLALLCL